MGPIENVKFLAKTIFLWHSPIDSQLFVDWIIFIDIVLLLLLSIGGSRIANLYPLLFYDLILLGFTNFS